LVAAGFSTDAGRIRSASWSWSNALVLMLPVACLSPQVAVVAEYELTPECIELGEVQAIQGLISKTRPFEGTVGAAS
jgi:hypothetical protein